MTIDTKVLDRYVDYSSRPYTEVTDQELTSKDVIARKGLFVDFEQEEHQAYKYLRVEFAPQEYQDKIKLELSTLKNLAGETSYALLKEHVLPLIGQGIDVTVIYTVAKKNLLFKRHVQMISTEGLVIMRDGGNFLDISSEVLI